MASKRQKKAIEFCQLPTTEVRGLPSEYFVNPFLMLLLKATSILTKTLVRFSESIWI